MITENIKNNSSNYTCTDFDLLNNFFVFNKKALNLIDKPYIKNIFENIDNGTIIYNFIYEKNNVLGYIKESNCINYNYYNLSIYDIDKIEFLGGKIFT